MHGRYAGPWSVHTWLGWASIWLLSACRCAPRATHRHHRRPQALAQVVRHGLQRARDAAQLQGTHAWWGARQENKLVCTRTRCRAAAGGAWPGVGRGRLISWCVRASVCMCVRVCDAAQLQGGRGQGREETGKCVRAHQAMGIHCQALHRACGARATHTARTVGRHALVREEAVPPSTPRLHSTARPQMRHTCVVCTLLVSACASHLGLVHVQQRGPEVGPGRAGQHAPQHRQACAAVRVVRSVNREGCPCGVGANQVCARATGGTPCVTTEICAYLTHHPHPHHHPHHAPSGTAACPARSELMSSTSGGMPASTPSPATSASPSLAQRLYSTWRAGAARQWFEDHNATPKWHAPIVQHLVGGHGCMAGRGARPWDPHGMGAWCITHPGPRVWHAPLMAWHRARKRAGRHAICGAQRKG